MSPDMIKALKHESISDPMRKKALDRLLKDTPANHTPQAISNIDIGYSGKGTGHKEFTKDAEIAYSASLLFIAQDNPKYADLAINILRAWSTVNKTFKGDNAPLEAAWGIASMAMAAELLKYSKAQQKYASIEPNFTKWITDTMLPALNEPSVWRWKIKNNWHFSILFARAQLAILFDDSTTFNQVFNQYKTILPQAICQGHPCHLSETLRDCTHFQFLIGGIISMAELAYHQGYKDAYDPKLHPIIEYHATIMLQEVPPGIKKEQINTPYGFWYEPVWEIAYAHFNNRLNLPMPKTEQWLAKIRPERVCFQWGPGTLTHYKRCNASKISPS
jgi:hypothetical protein